MASGFGPEAEPLAGSEHAVVGGARETIRLGSSSAVRATTLLVALTFLASLTNYASNLIFGRVLSPASFADLTALLALLVIIAVPTGAAQTMIAERVAVMNAAGDESGLRYTIRHASAHMLVIALVVGAVYTLFIPLTTRVLDLQAVGPALALAPLLFLSLCYPYALGILQGFERFAVLGAMLFLAAIMRLAFGVPWALAGGGAGGAIGGQAVGLLVAVLFVGWFLRAHHLAGGTGAARAGLRRVPSRRSIIASVAFVAFAAMSNLDVLMAKLYLPGPEAGDYAALVTLEKMILFLPAAVAVAMVPAAARQRLSDGSAARVLRVAALVVAGTTLLVAIPAALAPETVLRLMFGGRYTAAAGGVLPIVIAGAILALLNLLVVYTVAIQDRGWVWLLAAGVGLQAVAFSLFHASATQMAIVQAVVVVTVLAINEALFHPLLRTRTLLRQNTS